MGRYADQSIICLLFEGVILPGRTIEPIRDDGFFVHEIVYKTHYD
jgi:hypothetical protein